MLTDEQIQWHWGNAHNDTTDRLPFQVFARAVEDEVTAPLLEQIAALTTARDAWKTVANLADEDNRECETKLACLAIERDGWMTHARKADLAGMEIGRKLTAACAEHEAWAKHTASLTAHLSALTIALNNATISSWQTTAGWQTELDAATEFLSRVNQGD